MALMRCKCALDPGPVIQVEIADTFHHILKHDRRDLLIGEHDFAVGITRGGHPAQVQNDFQQFVDIAQFIQPEADRAGQHFT
jgi:hypothetical protein